MYLIPKEPQVDQKDGSSNSKSSKLLTKVLGDSEEILRYDGMRKKNVAKVLSTYLQNIKKFVLSCKLKYW